MNILFLEPFFGGSHKDFALGFKFKASCNHEVTLMTLPDRFWKWRMRGAAVYFANQISNISDYDLIMATDMLDLTDFIALAGKKCPPVWLYFHENQLDYPLAPGEKRDFHLGFTNIISALAADKVFFNSTYHLNTFITHAENLISKMPDYPPDWVMEQIKHKCCVVSCANQENFGISVVEAVRYGCIPLLPKRLSYPEIIPEKYHSTLLYNTDSELETRLEELVSHYASYAWVQPGLSEHMARYAWQNIITSYHGLV